MYNLAAARSWVNLSDDDQVERAAIVEQYAYRSPTARYTSAKEKRGQEQAA